MKSFFFFDADTGVPRAKWALPSEQTEFENCTMQNYNVVPTKNRDILVHGTYQSGIGVVDFTDLDESGRSPTRIPSRRTRRRRRRRRLVVALLQRADLPVRHHARAVLLGDHRRRAGGTKLRTPGPQTQEFTTSG